MIKLDIAQEVIDRLPSPRGVALALTEVCRKENVHLQEISNLVCTDPALSGRLLAMANAAASGGRNIASVDEAVSRLGIASVSQISLAFSLIDQYSDGFCINFDYAGYWSQSILMAAASRELGTTLRLGSAGDLFSVGLLSQIGRLALATAYPKEYADLVVSDIDFNALLHKEQVLSRTNHMQLSVAMMEHWGVPEDFAQPFGNRASPNISGSPHSTIRERRAQLAQQSLQLATSVASDGINALMEEERRLQTLNWLNIDLSQYVELVGRIESTWRLWLGLMARSVAR
jgi:HD-like signal output (HDOD) protein